MKKSRARALVGGAAMAAAGVAGLATPASAHPNSWYANCTNFNKHYPHGVGRTHAHDHSSSTPVTDFVHSTRLYDIAIRHNSDLDRDKDGVACERA